MEPGECGRREVPLPGVGERERVGIYFTAAITPRVWIWLPAEPVMVMP